MKTLSRIVMTAAASSLTIVALGCGYGTGSVYVGVGVAGPWGGYPYGCPSCYYGRPPRYYDEDALNRSAPTAERLARADDTDTLSVEVAAAAEAVDERGASSKTCSATATEGSEDPCPEASGAAK